MTRYHVSKNGEPGVCQAEHNCPLGGEGDHIETNDIKKARNFAEEKLAEEYNSVPASHSKAAEASIDTEREKALSMLPDPRIVNTISELSEDEINTVNTLAKKEYKDRLSSTDDEKEIRSAQIAYDATPAGKKELESQLQVERAKQKADNQLISDMEERVVLAERNKEVVAGYYLRS